METSWATDGLEASAQSSVVASDTKPKNISQRVDCVEN